MYKKGSLVEAFLSIRKTTEDVDNGRTKTVWFEPRLLQGFFTALRFSAFVWKTFFPCAAVMPRPTLLILEYVFGKEESISASVSTFKESNKKKTQTSAFQEVHGFD